MSKVDSIGKGRIDRGMVWRGKVRGRRRKKTGSEEMTVLGRLKLEGWWRRLRCLLLRRRRSLLLMLGRRLLELLLLVAVSSTVLSSSSSSTTSLAPFSVLLLLLLELGGLFVSSLNGAKFVGLLPVLSGSLPLASR